jgi:cysteinyl-tRNA synthetase
MSEEVMRLIQLREEVRRRRDWKEADRIRAELMEKGVVLEDTSEGVKWRLRRRSSGG